MNLSERVAFRYLTAGTIRVPPGLLKEVTDWALSNWSWAAEPYVEAFKIHPPKRLPEKIFTFEGNATDYPQLEGFTREFRGAYKTLHPGIDGSWNNMTKTLSVSSNVSDPDEVRRIVRHELQHAMQFFLASALNLTRPNLPRDSGVGMPPLRDRTPKYRQHGDAASVGADPAYLHDLDDMEFHTELEDARDALRAELKRETEYTPSYVFRKFVDSNKFLKALRSVPDARRKYRTAIKELSKVLS